MSEKRKFTSVKVSKEGNVTSIVIDPSIFSTVDYKFFCSEVEEICTQINEDTQTNVALFSIENNNPTYSLQRIDFESIESIEYYRVASKIDKIQCPVIVKMNGYIVDNLLEIALSADIRIATTESKFVLNHINNGFLPWDGATQRLPRAIGKSKSIEMILSGKKLSTEEALKSGLINYIFSQPTVDKNTAEIVHKLGSLAPIALRYVKEAVKEGLDMNLRQGFLFESDLSILLHSSRDRQKGLDSFKTKENPQFTGE